MTTPGERLFTWLIRFYPREFRERYHDDLVTFFRQDRNHPRYGAGLLRPLRFWIATARDLVRTAWGHRQLARQRQSMELRTHNRLIGRLHQDLRFAWRGLWAAPGVTMSALLVLTLGIGTGTAVFSVVDAVALRGLPFPDQERLVRLDETFKPSGRAPVQPQNYLDWRTRQDAFEHIGALASAPAFALKDEPATNLRIVAVTASLFDVLGVKPARGRVFTPAEEQAGADPVVVISHRLWQGRFAADPGIVGRVIATTKADVRVVGVMPPGFTYPLASVTAGTVDVWTPFVPTAEMTVRSRTHRYTLNVIARLQPGGSLENAQARMSRLHAAIATSHPDWFENSGGVLVRGLLDSIVDAPVRSWMLLLLGAVMVVVVMACLNAANLLVARALVRSSELAVRTALGATRWDLARSLLVESLLLSVIGAAGGILVAIWGVEILRSALPTSVPRLATVALDARVLMIAAVSAIVSGAIFGTIPALQASRPDIVTLLGHGGRSHSGGRMNRRIRAGLVIAQVTLAVVLLSGSGLFLASFLRVTSVDLGFDPRQVVTFLGASMSSSDIVPATTPEKRIAAQNGQAVVFDALDRLRAVPGVVAVSVIQGGSPLTGNSLSVEVQPADRRSGPFTGPDEPFVRSASPDYLDVIRGTLVSGRWIEDTDTVGSTPVVVLSEVAARRYFGSENPLGKGLLMSDYERTVVGITRPLRWRGPESEVQPEAFIPFRQTAHPTAQLIVRTNQDPATLAPALQDVIRAAMPGVTVGAPQFLERSYDGLLAQRRFNMIILLLFGVVAVIIAAIGIYGLMSFLVAQRRREIGVRVALGAVPSGILSMMLGRAMRLMILGLVPGIVAALLLEQTARAFLFDATPHDPAIYVLVVAVFLAAGLFAALGPARRATRVDPLVALRQD